MGNLSDQPSKVVSSFLPIPIDVYWEVLDNMSVEDLIAFSMTTNDNHNEVKQYLDDYISGTPADLERFAALVCRTLSIHEALTQLKAKTTSLKDMNLTFGFTHAESLFKQDEQYLERLGKKQKNQSNLLAQSLSLSLFKLLVSYDKAIGSKNSEDILHYEANLANFENTYKNYQKGSLFRKQAALQVASKVVIGFATLLAIGIFFGFIAAASVFSGFALMATLAVVLATPFVIGLPLMGLLHAIDKGKKPEISPLKKSAQAILNTGFFRKNAMETDKDPVPTPGRRCTKD